jgi:hemerythrin-like domain-containing protein
MIRTHIRKEETILFPMAETVLSAEQDETVHRQLNEFHVEDGYLSDLRRLEWKYLRRRAA